MRKLTYLAVFEPTETGYSVYFSDLPGCVSYGEDFEEAQKQAAEALALHVYGMEKDGDEIPAPSKEPQIDPETAAGYLVSPVTVFPDIVKNELDNRAVKTNLTIPAWLKELAEAEGVNYSKVFQAALMDYLGINKDPMQKAMSVLTKLRNRSQVTLPKEVVKELNLKIGDDLKVEVKSGCVVITPVAVIPKDELWACEPEIREAINEGRKEVRTGKLKVYESLDEVFEEWDEEEAPVESNNVQDTTDQPL